MRDSLHISFFVKTSRKFLCSRSCNVCVLRQYQNTYKNNEGQCGERFGLYVRNCAQGARVFNELCDASVNTIYYALLHVSQNLNNKMVRRAKACLLENDFSKWICNCRNREAIINEKIICIEDMSLRDLANTPLLALKHSQLNFSKGGIKRFKRGYRFFLSLCPRRSAECRSECKCALHALYPACDSDVCPALNMER